MATLEQLEIAALRKVMTRLECDEEACGRYPLQSSLLSRVARFVRNNKLTHLSREDQLKKLLAN